MVSFLISVILFIITLPMKAIALGAKAVKTTAKTAKAVDKSRKNIEKATGVAKTKKKARKKFRDSALSKIGLKREKSEAEKRLGKFAKFTTKVAKVATKGLITFLRFLSLVFASTGIFSMIITSVCALFLVASIASVLLFSEGWEFSSGGNSFMSGGSNESGGVSDEQAQKDWLDFVIKVETEMTKQNPNYAHKGESTKFKWEGKEYTWRYDCSGTVSLCLQLYNGSISSPLSSGGFMSLGSLSGFTKLKSPGDINSVQDLKPGDIVCSSGHMEVVESVGSDGKMKVRSWGSEESAKKNGESNPTYTYSGCVKKGNHEYKVIWRAKGSSKGGSSGGNWTIFFQSDSKWGNQEHAKSSGTISSSGCGTCASAMVLTHYSGDQSKYTPDKVSKKERDNGLLGPNKSTTTIPKIFNSLYSEVGLSCTDSISGKVDLGKLDACLKAGGCAIVDYGPNAGGEHGIFTTGDGHYVVVVSGNQTDGYHTVDSNGGHENGTRGKASWAPYSKHVFDKKYIQDSKYYYLITKK